MTRTGGPGVIPFELAGTEARAEEILASWGPRGRSAARLSLLLDYPFLVTYSVFNLAGCGAASTALRGRGARRLAAVGRLAGRAQVAAGAFDAVENTALLGVLSGRTGWLPAVARASAQAKFALLFVGWLYQALGGAAYLLSSARKGLT